MWKTGKNISSINLNISLFDSDKKKPHACVAHRHIKYLTVHVGRKRCRELERKMSRHKCASTHNPFILIYFHKYKFSIRKSERWFDEARERAGAIAQWNWINKLIMRVCETSKCRIILQGIWYLMMLHTTHTHTQTLYNHYKNEHFWMRNRSLVTQDKSK